MKWKKVKIMKQLIFVNSKGESIGNIVGITTYRDHFYVLTDKGVYTDERNEEIPTIGKVGKLK